MNKEKFNLGIHEETNKREGKDEEEQPKGLEEAKERLSVLKSQLDSLVYKWVKAAGWVTSIATIALVLHSAIETGKNDQINKKLEKISWATRDLAEYEQKHITKGDTLNESDYTKLIKIIDSEIQELKELVK